MRHSVQKHIDEHIEKANHAIADLKSRTDALEKKLATQNQRIIELYNDRATLRVAVGAALIDLKNGFRERAMERLSKARNDTTSATEAAENLADGIMHGGRKQ